MNKKLLTILCVCSSLSYGQTVTDNEIFIDQTGDTLALTIDQIGYGNKLVGELAGGIASADSYLIGTSLTMNIDQIGNNNWLVGSIALDNSTIDLTFTGDDNQYTWDIGTIGSADATNIYVDITGDSNVIGYRQGEVATAERLDLDWTMIGSYNTFELDFESDDIVWNVYMDGDSNSVTQTVSDGAYHTTNLDYTGSSGVIDITQSSGSCGIAGSCYSIIDATMVGDNATITIFQGDTND